MYEIVVDKKTNIKRIIIFSLKNNKYNKKKIYI